MKRKTATIFLLAWLLCAALLPVRGEEMPAPGGLSLLSFEIHIDEATDQIRGSFCIENESPQPWQGEIPLPLLSTGILPGSLSLETGSLAFLKDEKSLFCQIPAGGHINLWFRYQSAQPLIHARIIALDLQSSFFMLFSQVQHLLCSLTLREEDIPLVKEIYPGIWDFEENTIEIRLSRFKPSPLLSRIYVEKETYRNLKGSRDQTPTRVEEYILSHYSQWFAEGIPLPDNIENIYDVFNRMLDKKDTPRARELANWWEDYQSLIENNSVYSRLVHYLVIREAVRGNLAEEPAQRILGQLGFAGDSLGPLGSHLLQTHLYGNTEMYRLAVGFDAAKSLKNSQVYLYVPVSSTIEIDGTIYPFNDSVLKSFSPDKIPLIRPAYNISPGFNGFRVQNLPASLNPSPEELDNYLHALQADFYVQMRVMDARSTALPMNEYREGFSEKYTAYFTRVLGGLISEEGFQAAAEKEEEESGVPGYYRCYADEQADEALSALSLPSLIHYRGAVVLKEDPVGTLKGEQPFYEYFSDFSYGSSRYGITFYKKLLETDGITAWRQQREAEETARMAALEEKVRTYQEDALWREALTLPAWSSDRLAARFRLWEESSLSDMDDLTAAPCAAFHKHHLYENILGGNMP